MKKTFPCSLYVFIFLLLFSFFTIPVLAQPKVGDPVEVLYSGKWYKAKVLEAKDGKYKITYDGYSSAWDTWVEPTSIRSVNGVNNFPVNNTGGGNNNTQTNTTAGQFKVGDKVEASYAGDWNRATITGGFQDNGAEGTYEIRYDGSNYPERISTKWVRPLYRTDVNRKFNPGDKVLFKRWDDKEYEGEVVGADGNRYDIKYTKDGYKTNEWIPEIAVKASNNAAANTVAPTFKGQKYKVGDKVYYDGLGFLVGKRTGTIVSVDPEKRLYTIRDEKDPSSRYSYACYNVIGLDEKPDNSYFIGKWEVYVGGATSTFTQGNDLYRRFSGGMKLKPIDIRADGTYTWETDKKTITGRWQPRADVPGITILKGLDGLDWTIYQTTEAFATQKTTRDEFRFHHLPSNTGYYQAFRIGANKSCVLDDRKF